MSILETKEGVYAVLSFPTTREYATLSKSERHVVQMVLDGFSNREISWLRVVRLRTVINQIAAIFMKLGVSSRRELISKLSRPAGEVSKY